MLATCFSPALPDAAVAAGGGRGGHAVLGAAAAARVALVAADVVVDGTATGVGIETSPLFYIFLTNLYAALTRGGPNLN